MKVKLDCNLWQFSKDIKKLNRKLKGIRFMRVGERENKKQF